jgi:hypothetical protein
MVKINQDIIIYLFFLFFVLIIFFYFTNLEKEKIKLIEQENKNNEVQNLNNYGDMENTKITNTKKQNCINGQKESCELEDGCIGERVCIEGIWSECYKIYNCEPNKKVPCIIPNECVFGYKICDRCGSGWSECTK